MNKFAFQLLSPLNYVCWVFGFGFGFLMVVVVFLYSTGWNCSMAKITILLKYVKFTDVKINTCLSCNSGQTPCSFSSTLLFNLVQNTRALNNSLGDSLISGGYW